MPAWSRRLRRVCARLAAHAAVLCIPLWVLGHFLPSSLTFNRGATRDTGRLQLTSRIGWVRERYVAPAGVLAMSSATRTGVTATVTICNHRAAILLHRTLGAVPFDPTRFPTIAAPFWVLIPSLAALSYGLRYMARFDRGHCPRCGYNLTGLSPGSPCPECGLSTPRP